MNIKKLMTGSIAVIIAASGVRAEDAIVAPEPEPVEYVRVCAEYGSGYFYIPGSETCLKINGYIRFDVNFGFGDGFETSGVASGGGTLGATDDWNSRARGQVQLTAKSDTEYGPLTGIIVFQGNKRSRMVGVDGASLGGAQDAVLMDQAYIDVAGLRVGKFLNWWDADFSGETDIINSGSTTFNSVRYQYETDDFYAGIAVEELGGTSDFEAWQKGGNDIGIDTAIGGDFGSISYELLAGYDADADAGSVRLKLGADVGPGTIGIAGIYSSAPNAYFLRGEWAIAAQYAIKATDRFTITPGVQFTNKIDLDADGDYASGSELRAGITLDYQIAKNLSSKFALNYISREHDVKDNVSYTQGFFRLQRAF